MGIPKGIERMTNNKLKKDWYLEFMKVYNSTKLIDNFKNVKLWLIIPPFLLLSLIFFYIFLFNDGANFIDIYINIQKDLFFYLNTKLSVFPILQFNLTQLGDALILFPLITAFIIYAPKIWEVLLTSSIISLIISAILKKLFAVPRPAAVFNNNVFTIIGETLTGRSSLPSGHSITIFILVTVLLFGLMPKKNTNKIIWTFLIVLTGFIIAFSRVAVGAHYPLDVIIGSTIGFIATIIGITISNRISLFTWIKNKKYYPILMLILTIWGAFIIEKIINLNLAVFYVSLFSLIFTLYLLTSIYVKKSK